MAEAFHHRSDALSSVGTFAGILGGRLGLPILDPIAGFVVAVMIIWMGLRIIRASSDELMDAQTDPATISLVRTAAAGVEGVCDVHSVVARKYGGDSYVDLRIGVDPSISVVMGHEIAMQVESAVRSGCPSVRGVLVHVDPESVHVDDPEGHPLPRQGPNGCEDTAIVMHGPNGECME